MRNYILLLFLIYYCYFHTSVGNASRLEKNLKKSTYKIFNNFIYYFIAWFIAMNLFYFFRLFAIESMIKEITAGKLDLDLSLSDSFYFNNFLKGIFLASVQAFLAAIAYTYIGYFIRSKKFRRKSYLYIITYVSVIHITMFYIIVTVMLIIEIGYSGFEAFGSFYRLVQFFFQPPVLVILVYTIVVADVLNFTAIVSNRFGPGVLINIILGKYHKPREQERIFMFLDLKSSSYYAERLGHIKYSEMIQDCFYDLTDSIGKFDVEIYQYVGDEAVLTWKVENGIYNLNCIETFYSFEATLNSRKDYYIKKYGILPVFKAGLNMGKVTIAEVGVIKKEIAYHGDVLNTASRIQSKCNEYDEKILISGFLHDEMKKVNDFTSNLLGNISLKGKLKTVDIYSIAKV